MLQGQLITHKFRYHNVKCAILCASAYLLIRLVWQKHWWKISGIPGALKRTKILANYMYLHLHLDILKGVDRARMQQSKRKFLQKSVAERFGVGRPQNGFWLDFSGFLSLQGRSVRPRKIGQIVPRSEILTEILDFYFFHPFNPKNGPKLARSV
jgi:hypothetical protein